MEATTASATATTPTRTARHSPYRDLCPSPAVFWTCQGLNDFTGCCPHDPCHDGFCHELTEEVLSHMSLLQRTLFRRTQGPGDPGSGSSMSMSSAAAAAMVTYTYTETYTLVRLTESEAEGVLGTLSDSVAVAATATAVANADASAGMDVGMSVDFSSLGTKAETSEVVAGSVMGYWSGGDTAGTVTVRTSWTGAFEAQSFGTGSPGVFASSSMGISSAVVGSTHGRGSASATVTATPGSISATTVPYFLSASFSLSYSALVPSAASFVESKLTSVAASVTQPGVSLASTPSRANAVVSPSPPLVTAKPGKSIASVSISVKRTSQGTSAKSTAFSGGKVASSVAGESTHSPASSSLATTINPYPVPVPGGKKSKGTIAGITLGVLAAAAVILLLVYCCISRRRRSNPRPSKRSRGRRRSRPGDGVEVDVMKVKTTEDDVQSPMTPGGAKLEEQRVRMLKQEPVTGFRALGMTAAMGGDGIKNRSVPELLVPTAAMRASEHPAPYSSLSLGVVHPTHSHSVGGRTRSEVDLPSLPRQSAVSPDRERFYGGGVIAPVDATAETEYQARVSWEPGSDVIDVLRPGPLLVRPGITTVAADRSEKPLFSETTSRWAAVTSPTDIGQAVSTQDSVDAIGSDRRRDAADKSMAMSTVNELTSPVEDGGLHKPVRRNAYRGFEEMLNHDGLLK